jgi:preprotein translocase subunit SecA
MKWLKNIVQAVTDENRGALKKAKAIVPLVNAKEAAYRELSDDALRAKTLEFKSRLQEGETLDQLLPDAFAAVREASRRTLNQRHFDVQLIGGAVIHNGDIAEMRTGEGKTLVATLPAYLNALTGKGVHVVTVNDYLSRRDAVWMGQVYWALGMTTGVINHDTSFIYDPAHVPPQEEGLSDAERDETGSFKVANEFLRPCSRKEAYAADITYGTNNEFGFDYLRDNLVYDEHEVRQRPHHFAIVDEIDSILIDEARTPLIISAPSSDSDQLYRIFADIASQMEVGKDFVVDEKLRAISLTPDGITKAESALGVDNIYTDKGIKYVHHLETAVRAKALFHRDQEYVVKGDEVVIVDEFTGRMQPGRRWSEGLHQAIEAKESVTIQKESRTYASITFQNYFRLYEKLAGMAGTAVTSSEEFYKVYGLNTVVIPTNIPPKRIDNNDLIFKTEPGKWKAIARKVKELHEKGQPVLIGTVSVEKNELLSEQLRKVGVPHEVLNAKNHEREGAIIAEAGKRGAVTVATNMAGRGVDIKLGGNPSTQESYDEIKALGGLFVLGTERHEARRIDNQLRGRAGRQGDPGETQFFVSVEDSLMRVFGGERVQSVMNMLNIPEDEPIQNGMITKSLESAQTKIEGFHFDSRKQVLSYDDVMNIQRQSVYKRRNSIVTGGPAIDAELMRLSEIHPDLPAVVGEKKEKLGLDVFYPVARRVMLQTIDLLWVDHLEVMDYTRQNVNLRAYGQRDPLVEYKKDGTRLFKEMEASYAQHVANLLGQLQPEMFKSVETVQMREVKEGADYVSADRGGQIAKKAGHGRNDMVTITNGSETREMKYKKAEQLLNEGWRVVE